MKAKEQRGKKGKHSQTVHFLLLVWCNLIELKDHRSILKLLKSNFGARSKHALVFGLRERKNLQPARSISIFHWEGLTRIAS